VEDRHGRFLGLAFYSRHSKIRLRVFCRTRDSVDERFWWERAEAALDRRKEIAGPDEAFRAIFAESDGIPGLVVDAYPGQLVVQALTAATERVLPTVLDALSTRLHVQSVLARNDSPSRSLEGLPREVRAIRGNPPSRVEVREGGIVYLADTWGGQKTGAFLDQRENRLRLGEIARGRVLDVFSYHGSFALQAAQRAERVVAIDSSADALRRGKESAALNGFDCVEWIQGNAFEQLRSRVAAGETWDVVVVDPPAFAKGRADAEAARRAYKEVNLRAMRLVAPRGVLLTASCSYHLPEHDFYGVLEEAAADSRRVFRIEERRGSSRDHPERVGFPESRYLKCAFLAREETLE